MCVEPQCPWRDDNVRKSLIAELPSREAAREARTLTKTAGAWHAAGVKAFVPYFLEDKTYAALLGFMPVCAHFGTDYLHVVRCM